MVRDLKRPDPPKIRLEPLLPGTFEAYCTIGEQAYREHYLHLWPDQDPSPYLLTSFTLKVVMRQAGDKNNLLFMVRTGKEFAGIAKLVRHRGPQGTETQGAVFLEKIYLLSAYTGKGYGEQVMVFLHALARREGMKFISLAAMKKGRALLFYKKMGYQILGEKVLPFDNAVPEERGMYLLGRAL